MSQWIRFFIRLPQMGVLLSYGRLNIGWHLACATADTQLGVVLDLHGNPYYSACIDIKTSPKLQSRGSNCHVSSSINYSNNKGHRPLSVPQPTYPYPPPPGSQVSSPHNCIRITFSYQGNGVPHILTWRDSSGNERLHSKQTVVLPWTCYVLLVPNILTC